jgi:hypothetical protein
VLSQVVSPASSTYLYDLALSLDRIDFRDNRPVVGVLASVSGFSLTQVFVDEQCVVLKDRLTEEAARAVLEGDGFMEPLYVSGDLKGPLSQLLRHEQAELVTVPSDCAPSSEAFARHVLKSIGRLLAIDTSEFRLVHRGYEAGPNPVYVSTALQIGLLPNDNIPQLVPFLVPTGCRSYCGKFLRKLLLHPPPYSFADRVRAVLRILTGSGSGPVPALPSVHPVSVGKVVSLLSSGQCNAATFREIEYTLRGVQQLLEMADLEVLGGGGGALHELTGHLLELGAYESGVAIDRQQFMVNVGKTRKLISDRIAITDHNELSSHGSPDRMSRDPYSRIPDEFFSRNELEFRGCLATGM